MVDFQTIKSLAWTFAPFLISYGFSYYRSIRSQINANKPSVRPTPPHIRLILNVLFFASALCLLLSLPYFAPENLFVLTDSRLPSTSPELLFKRVASHRPHETLTPLDEKLKDKLVNHDLRCLYLLYGPDTLADCIYCESDDPTSYLLYSLPTLLLPHLLNALLLGLSTSISVGGREGSRWRLYAILAALAPATVDIYLHYSAPYKRNTVVFYASDLVYYHARFRMVRFMSIALLDAGFAGLLYAASTNRLFVQPYTASERIEIIGRAMEMTAGKLNAAGIVKNGQVRDAGLRAKSDDYWRREGEVMGEVMTSEEVSKAVSQALGSGRINMEKVEAEARTYVDSLLRATDGAAL